MAPKDKTIAAIGEKAQKRAANDREIVRLETYIAAEEAKIKKAKTDETENQRKGDLLASRVAGGDKAAAKEQEAHDSAVQSCQRMVRNIEAMLTEPREELAKRKADVTNLVFAENLEATKQLDVKVPELAARLTALAPAAAGCAGTIQAQLETYFAAVFPLLGEARAVVLRERARTVVYRAVKSELARAFTGVDIKLFGQHEDLRGAVEIINELLSDIALCIESAISGSQAIPAVGFGRFKLSGAARGLKLTGLVLASGDTIDLPIDHPFVIERAQAGALQPISIQGDVR